MRVTFTPPDPAETPSSPPPPCRGRRRPRRRSRFSWWWPPLRGVKEKGGVGGSPRPGGGPGVGSGGVPKDTVQVGVLDPEEVDVAVGQHRGEGALLLPLQQDPHEVLDLPQPHVPLVAAADQRLWGDGGGQEWGHPSQSAHPTSGSRGSPPLTLADLQGQRGEPGVPHPGHRGDPRQALGWSWQEGVDHKWGTPPQNRGHGGHRH